MKCIKFQDGLSPVSRKVVGVLEFFYFPKLIHECRFLEDFKNNQNNKSRNIEPQSNKKIYNDGKPYSRLNWKFPPG